MVDILSAIKEFFNYLDDRKELVFEKDPIHKILSDEQLVVYQHNGFWQPMDTSREFQLLNDIYSRGIAPWIKW